MNYLLIPTLLLAFGLFGIGILLARRYGRGLIFYLLAGIGAFAAIPGIVFTLYYLKLFHEATWLYEFRSWPFTELTASGAGLLAGLLHGRYSSQARFRRIAGRWFFPGVLVLGLLVPYAKPIVLAPRWGQFQDLRSEGICLQTSESSCGPACAATLLWQFGKAATEKEIARECFTCRTGTESWYLARALRQRGIKVRFVIEKDPNKPWPFPAIAGVRLPSVGNLGHYITLLGRTGDSYIIGDPLEGRLLLPSSAPQENYVFTGLFMVLE